MRKFVSTLMGLLLLATTVAAQGHDNNNERKAADDMSVGAALRVGPVTLPSGDYRVVCDRTKVVFTRTLDGKRFELPCQGKELDKKAGATRFVTDVDKDGVRYLKTLMLKGSTIEHVF